MAALCLVLKEAWRAHKLKQARRLRPGVSMMLDGVLRAAHTLDESQWHRNAVAPLPGDTGEEAEGENATEEEGEPLGQSGNRITRTEGGGSRVGQNVWGGRERNKRNMKFCAPKLHSSQRERQRRGSMGSPAKPSALSYATNPEAEARKTLAELRGKEGLDSVQPDSSPSKAPPPLRRVTDPSQTSLLSPFWGAVGNLQSTMQSFHARVLVCRRPRPTTAESQRWRLGQNSEQTSSQSWFSASSPPNAYPASIAKEPVAEGDFLKAEDPPMSTAMLAVLEKRLKAGAPPTISSRSPQKPSPTLSGATGPSLPSQRASRGPVQPVYQQSRHQQESNKTARVSTRAENQQLPLQAVSVSEGLQRPWSSWGGAQGPIREGVQGLAGRFSSFTSPAASTMPWGSPEGARGGLLKDFDSAAGGEAGEGGGEGNIRKSARGGRAEALGSNAGDVTRQPGTSAMAGESGREKRRDGFRRGVAELPDSVARGGGEDEGFGGRLSFESSATGGVGGDFENGPSDQSSRGRGGDAAEGGRLFRPSQKGTGGGTEGADLGVQRGYNDEEPPGVLRPWRPSARGRAGGAGADLGGASRPSQAPELCEGSGDNKAQVGGHRRVFTSRALSARGDDDEADGETRQESSGALLPARGGAGDQGAAEVGEQGASCPPLPAFGGRAAGEGGRPEVSSQMSPARGQKGHLATAAENFQRSSCVASNNGEGGASAGPSPYSPPSIRPGTSPVLPGYMQPVSRRRTSVTSVAGQHMAALQQHNPQGRTLFVPGSPIQGRRRPEMTEMILPDQLQRHGGQGEEAYDGLLVSRQLSAVTLPVLRAPDGRRQRRSSVGDWEGRGGLSFAPPQASQLRGRRTSMMEPNLIIPSAIAGHGYHRPLQ